jgi:hypothetical protein
MHARNRTWLLGSDPVERCRQRTLPVEGGDGSTLSLDFTTGVLDPRLTFTRTTNATFINSQGLVEWAQANLMTQSNAFTTSPWASTNVSMTTDGESPVGSAWRMTENSALASVHRLDPAAVTCSNGVISISVYVKQGSGTRQAYFLVSDNATGEVRSKRLNPVDGSLQGTESTGGSWASASTSVVNVGDGWYRLVLTVTKGGGSGVIVRMGMSDSSGNLSYNGDGTSYLLFSGVQINPGSVQSYVATSGSIYQAPRFDYDPSTTPPQPRGLLIEGSASNLLKHSQGLFTSWIQFGTVGALTTGITSPSGDSSAVSLNLNTAGNNGYYTNNTQMGYTNTVGATYTFSIWVRATGSTTNLNIRFGDSAVGYSANIPITTSWQRLQYSYVAVAASGPTIASATGTATGVVELWGAQLEAGSGASSYIPTGASTGNRAADVCYITNADYGFTTTGGTYFVEWERGEFATVSGQACNPFSTDYASGRWLGIGTAPAGTTATAGSWSGFLNATGAAVAGRNRAAVSYSSWVASASGVFRVNGGSEITGTLTLGTTPTYLMIGSASASAPYNGGGLRDFVNSRIRRIKYWPSVLPSATLQAITVNT